MGNDPLEPLLNIKVGRYAPCTTDENGELLDKISKLLHLKKMSGISVMECHFRCNWGYCGQ